jgi:hypothetical protein
MPKSISIFEALSEKAALLRDPKFRALLANATYIPLVTRSPDEIFGPCPIPGVSDEL